MKVEIPANADMLVSYVMRSIYCRHKPAQQSKGKRPLWSVIRDYFGIGSTTAKALCRWDGLDPDELVNGKARY